MTDEETRWRDDLSELVKRFHGTSDRSLKFTIVGEMPGTAARLHNSLKQHGHEPRHHAYMLTNRRCSPDDPEFYHQIHAVEDLIKFTENEHANEDPIDQTLDAEFDFRVRSRRREGSEVYKLVRTESGWFVEGDSYSGPCDPSGYPVVFESLRNDLIKYPAALGEWFEWLWRQAKDRGLTREQVQEAIDEMADWVDSTATHAPMNGVWAGLA